MSNYAKALELEAKKRGWTPEQVAIFEDWRKNVEYVESKNNPKAIQKLDNGKSGPGRGIYQYEILGTDNLTSTNGSGASIDARDNLKKYLKRNNLSIDLLPKTDIEVLNTENPDFSKLSEDTQRLAFLADKSISPKTSLNDLVSGKISQGRAWADWHWKGAYDKKAKKIIPEKRAPKLEQWNREILQKQKQKRAEQIDPAAPMLAQEQMPVQAPMQYADMFQQQQTPMQIADLSPWNADNIFGNSLA